MPCDFRIPPGVTKAARREQIREATARLEAALRIGTVTVKVGPSGSITFAGWKKEDRDGMTDLCAYRKLMAAGSTALRLALAKGEAMAGRQVDKNAVAGGVHSHDGGKTWGKD